MNGGRRVGSIVAPNMKRCPQCNRIESDNSLAFCRIDGSPLAEASSEIETSLLPHAVTDPLSPEVNSNSGSRSYSCAAQ